MNLVRFFVEWIALCVIAIFAGQALFPRVRRQWVWLVAVAGSAVVIFGWSMLVFRLAFMR
ncbi:MAG: hypothetical protein ACYC6I_12890 [Bacillota bacterium]